MHILIEFWFLSKCSLMQITVKTIIFIIMNMFSDILKNHKIQDVQ